MRLASVALVLVLFAAAVSATKDGAAADGKSELAIKLAKESADDMSKKAANLKQKADNKKAIKETTTDVTKDGEGGLNAGKQSIEAQKEAAESEKHKCDCEACSMSAEANGKSEFELHDLSCKSHREELVAKRDAAKIAHKKMMDDRDKAVQAHKDAVKEEQFLCIRKVVPLDAAAVAAANKIPIATAAVVAEQEEVDNTVQTIFDLRKVATDLDFAKFQANQYSLDVSNAGEKSTCCVSLTCFLL
jgi:hypothetical protein